MKYRRIEESEVEEMEVAKEVKKIEQEERVITMFFW